MTSYLAAYDAIPADQPRQRSGYIAALLGSHPRELFRELRDHRPIFDVPSFTLITRFSDVEEVLSRNDEFTVKLYAQRMDDVVDGPFMLARDNCPANWREKSIMKAMLRPEELSIVRAMAGRLADASLDDCMADGCIETVSRLGREVPVRICGEYFGFPGPDMATMYRWSKATQSDMFKNLSNDQAIHAASVQAGKEMLPYLGTLLTEKRAALMASSADSAPPQGVFSRLIRTAFPTELEFDDRRIIANVAGLLIGTVETTSQAIVQVIAELLGRPEELAGAQEAASSGDDERFDGYVWEALRFAPINPLIFRLCESDYLLAASSEHRATIKAGTVVFACTESAMFDPREIEEPESFNPRRPAYQTMFFGYGDHVCLGKYLGLMIIPEVVKRVLLRPNIRTIPGDAGKLDFEGGFFPERFTVAYGPKSHPQAVSEEPTHA